MAKNDILLTILIPVYNTEKYIEKCLKSVAIDKLQNKIEIIVVSDGSTDSSIDIANKFLAEYPSLFRIVEKKNGGHGSTINVGIKKARGKYFRVLDSDDWFDVAEFIKYVDKLSNCNSDLVISDYSKVYSYDDKSSNFVFNRLEDSKEYVFDCFNLDMLEGKFFAMANIAYKTSLLRKINFKLPEKMFYVDMLFDILPIISVNSFTYYSCNVYKYLIGREGQSVNVKSYVKNYKDHDYVTKELINEYTRAGLVDGDVKKKYISEILKIVIDTNYLIYLLYFRNSKLAYRLVSDFDNYLLNKSKDLYFLINSFFIKCNRKTRFIFVLLAPSFVKSSLYNIWKRITGN